MNIYVKFLIGFILFLCIISYIISANPSIVDPDLYPEYSNLVKNKDIILKELFDCMTTNIWTKIDENDMANSIIHKKSTYLEVYQYTTQNNATLNVGNDPELRVFFISFLKDQIAANSFYCKETFKLIQKMPNVKSSYFMCLEPKIRIAPHSAHDSDILKCIIPLIIPPGDSGLNIDSEHIQWESILKNKKFLIFDEGYSHTIWNNTNENLILLIIDIVKI
jgi:aspartyl/asparaginyl beta-hydroxylase (cupin superfamily)